MGRCLDRLRGLIPSMRREGERNAAKAAQYLQDEFRRDLAHPGSETVHSRPGQAPFKITGDYQLSFTGKVVKGRSIAVQTTAAQLLHWLNEGTRRMAPRPHRNATIERTRPRVLEILRGK
jgi:hypothetical protein